MADFDVIDEVIVEANEDDRFLEVSGNIITADPVIIRGNGNFTLYVHWKRFLFVSNI
jgi:hypothetical protein